MMHTLNNLRRTSARRGTIYVTVLSVATLVSLLGISAVTAARLRGRSSGSGGDVLDAQAYALAATELGRLWISQDPNWATNRTNGYWATQVALGKGTYSLNVYGTTAGGALTSNKPVILVGTGYQGTATQSVQVQLTPTSSAPLSCLSVAACINSNATFTIATVNGNQILGGNGAITATAATINCAVQGVVTPTGATYNSTHTGGATAYQLPTAATLWTTYAGGGNSTTINFASIPLVGGVATLSGKTFSSSSNPINPASPDPNGVYYIDCGGSTLNISACHVVGTLVLKSPGASSSISGSNYFEPGPANGPVLLVNGNASIKTNNTSFTLAGTTYPSAFKGVVYVSGNLTTATHPVFNGCVVAQGGWTCGGAVDLNYDPTIAQSPPQGFGGTAQMLVVSGTWQ